MPYPVELTAEDIKYATEQLPGELELRMETTRQEISRLRQCHSAYQTLAQAALDMIERRTCQYKADEIPAQISERTGYLEYASKLLDARKRAGL